MGVEVWVQGQCVYAVLLADTEFKEVGEYENWLRKDKAPAEMLRLLMSVTRSDFLTLFPLCEWGVKLPVCRGAATCALDTCAFMACLAQCTT